MKVSKDVELRKILSELKITGETMDGKLIARQDKLHEIKTEIYDIESCLFALLDYLNLKFEKLPERIVIVKTREKEKGSGHDNRKG